eukprot:COSAG01_NODE_37_length_34085_cov_64.376626_33_plen_254_part_00
MAAGATVEALASTVEAGWSATPSFVEQFRLRPEDAEFIKGRCACEGVFDEPDFADYTRVSPQWCLASFHSDCSDFIGVLTDGCPPSAGEESDRRRLIDCVIKIVKIHLQRQDSATWRFRVTWPKKRYQDGKDGAILAKYSGNWEKALQRPLVNADAGEDTGDDDDDEDDSPGEESPAYLLTTFDHRLKHIEDMLGGVPELRSKLDKLTLLVYGTGADTVDGLEQQILELKVWARLCYLAVPVGAPRTAVPVRT